MIVNAPTTEQNWALHIGRRRYPRQWDWSLYFGPPTLSRRGTRVWGWAGKIILRQSLHQGIRPRSVIASMRGSLKRKIGKVSNT